MGYDKRIQTLSQKYRQFFSDKSPGQILVTICPYTFDLPYGDFGLPGRPLSSWDFDRELEAYVGHAVARHRVFMDCVKGLDNDYVPALNLNFGFGVHSAYFSGAQVRMGADTSWTRPWLTDLNQLEALRMDENNRWFQRILEGCRILMDRCDGDFAPSAFANAGPGDMANAIRGDALFTDLYDEPDRVHALMDKCTDAAIWLEESIHAIIGDVEGGQVTANCWFPGRAPYLSEDFNDLLSPGQYEAFGRGHTERFIARFGGAYVHHHAKGAHIHGLIASLPHLSMLEQSWDPNCPRPIERLDELFALHGDLPLMVRCHARDLAQHIEALKQGRVVVMLNIDSLDEGREAMRLVRRHSKI